MDLEVNSTGDLAYLIAFLFESFLIQLVGIGSIAVLGCYDFRPLGSASGSCLPQHRSKVKIEAVRYTFLRKEVPVRESTYPELSAYELGWPIPFFTTFIF